ncbi:MAG: hypothetical protein CML50_06360 [Rhodobacteraceae bacterium]|nr:hypothetical protein [Paracoccaceae bacterium]GGA22505.1 hypothetical protein GCM10011326_38740 [Salipiger profundus]
MSRSGLCIVTLCLLPAFSGVDIAPHSVRTNRRALRPVGTVAPPHETTEGMYFSRRIACVGSGNGTSRGQFLDST